MRFFRKHRENAGQGVIEYGLMIALLTVLVFAVIPFLSGIVDSLEFDSASSDGKEIIETVMDECEDNDDCTGEESDEDSDGDADSDDDSDDDGCEDDPDSDEEEGDGDSDCDDDDDGEGDSDSTDDDA